jgi:probable F420-dependent oxidoreductase
MRRGFELTKRPIRLAINLQTQAPMAEVVEQARRAEQIGFDTVYLPDHIGYLAPLPTAVAVAAATESVLVGPWVLNTGFYRPALLARDLAGVDAATGGRLEIGLGTGYMADEFAAAGLPFPSPGERIRTLGEHITAIRAALSDPEYHPAPIQQPPTITVAGSGDRLLAMAAQHADIVSIGGLGTEADIAERVGYVKAKAGPRIADIELSFGFFQVAIDKPDYLPVLDILAPESSDAERRQMATLLEGPVPAAAERIDRLRELGISYFSIGFNDGLSTSWESMEKLVAAVKG